MDTNPHSQCHVEVVNLKISGWSVKQTGSSLLCTLGKLGTVACFIHYPEIQTCYVTVMVPNRRSAIESIEASFPSARVTTSRSDASKSERAFESAQLTAVLSSHSRFSETEAYSRLNRFGKIRVLECFRSFKSGKYFCKASFYESHCLEEFISKHHTIAFQGKSDRSPREVRVARLLPKAHQAQKKTGSGKLLAPHEADKVSSPALDKNHQLNCRTFERSTAAVVASLPLDPAPKHISNHFDEPNNQQLAVFASDAICRPRQIVQAQGRRTDTCSHTHLTLQRDARALVNRAHERDRRPIPDSTDVQVLLSPVASNRRSRVANQAPAPRTTKKKNAYRSASQGQAARFAVKKIFQSDDENVYNQLTIHISSLRGQRSASNRQSVGNRSKRSKSCTARAAASDADRNLLNSRDHSSDELLGLLSFLELDCGKGMLGKLPVHTGVASKSSARGCVGDAANGQSYLSLGDQSDGITVSEELRTFLNELNNIKQGTTRQVSSGGLVVSHFKFQLTHSTEAVSAGTPVFTEHSNSTLPEGRFSSPSPRRQYICPQTQHPLCVQYFTVPGS